MNMRPTTKAARRPERGADAGATAADPQLACAFGSFQCPGSARADRCGELRGFLLRSMPAFPMGHARLPRRSSCTRRVPAGGIRAIPPVPGPVEVHELVTTSACWPGNRCELRRIHPLDPDAVGTGGLSAIDLRHRCRDRAALSGQHSADSTPRAEWWVYVAAASACSCTEPATRAT